MIERGMTLKPSVVAMINMDSSVRKGYSVGWGLAMIKSPRIGGDQSAQVLIFPNIEMPVCLCILPDRHLKLLQ